MFNKYSEQIELLNKLNSEQMKVIDGLINNYSLVVMHIKNLHQRVEDLELKLQGLMQLTLTRPPKKKAKKRKVKKEVKYENLNQGEELDG